MPLKKVELQDLTLDDLKAKLEEYNTRYTKTRFNHTITPIENPSSLKYMRKDIARIKTAISKQIK